MSSLGRPTDRHEDVAARTQGASSAARPDLSGSIPVERVNEHLTEDELREVHEGIERELLGESAAYPWRNVPVKPLAQTSAGICGMHGCFVGLSCPKCVAQPKVTT